MPNYLDIQKEETLKARVFADYFGEDRFGYEPNIDNIDFVTTDKTASRYLRAVIHYFWAEVKKGVFDVASMITQLILTCKKTYDKGDYLPPPFIGCFDSVKIAFLPFHDILPIFAEADFNWNTTPSDHDAPDFQKARSKVAKLILKNIIIFEFETDEKEIKEFIKNNFIHGASGGKSPITKNNFPHIYYKWVKEVKPFINISSEEWLDFKRNGILDCDFFRADMMSEGGNSIVKKLKIMLDHDNYKLQEEMRGRFYFTNIDFTDGGAAYNVFWNKYERPPADEYQQYIIDRRDLLVPQNIREVKGSFFTPAVWVEKSQEYLADVFGDNWQDEYYIWDCAAGTGNLLAGLINKDNIWASDIDAGNINTIHEMIEGGLNLWANHVFQFDFLNDYISEPLNIKENEKAQRDLSKLEQCGLKKILDDPEKRKKLIIYINPPYAEASSYGFSGKPQVANETKVFQHFSGIVGAEAMNEIFAQFFTRIFFALPMAKIASFSKAKFITSTKFVKFRSAFKSEYKKGFICLSSNFDNVKGKFPILFSIWDTEKPDIVNSVIADIFMLNISQDIPVKCGEKTFYASIFTIADWRKTIYNGKNNIIGYLIIVGPSMQSNNNTFFTNKPAVSYIKKKMVANITQKNIIEMCIYLAVRHTVLSTWINDCDQFLFPNDGWKNDTEFQHNCLALTLFHGQNRISCNDGVNHWIPFTEKEVDAKEKFESNFMSAFLKDKEFSDEARSVLAAGLELWKYYHQKTKTNRTVSVNASFYDIREFFQRRNDAGKMNNKSNDETYNALIKTLRETLDALAKKIDPKVYEYGFLKE